MFFFSPRTLKLSLILKHNKYLSSQKALCYYTASINISGTKKKKIKIKTGHLVYLRYNSMWTTAGAIFSTTSAIKLYLCRRLLGCSWPEIETDNMSWVPQVTGEGSLRNTWIKKSSKWISLSFPFLKSHLQHNPWPQISPLALRTEEATCFSI